MPLSDRLKNVMAKLDKPYEIIFVNDGSRDRSFDVLRGLVSQQAHFVVINLKKRCGKSEALQAGFDIAQGKIVITMDGDLQNDPEDIPRLLSKLKDGYDAVCGWRTGRKDPWVKIFASKIANTIRRIVTKEKVHDVGCGLAVFKKEILGGIFLSSGLHRFLMLIISKLGYKIAEVKIQHHSRQYGVSKYNEFHRICEGTMDLIRIIFYDIDDLMKRNREIILNKSFENYEDTIE